MKTLSAASLGLAGLLMALPSPVAAQPVGDSCVYLTLDDTDDSGTDDVFVFGSPAGQSVVVSVRAADVEVRVDCNKDGDFVDTGEGTATIDGSFETIHLDLKGNDSVLVSFPEAAYLGRTFNVVALLGTGTNSFTLDASTVNFQGGARLLVDVTGGPGADKVTVKLPLAESSALRVRADLAAGNDVLDIDGDDLLSGATSSVEAALGNGSNSFDLLAKAVTGSSSYVRVEGGTGADTVAATLAGAVSAGGRIEVTADLGAGNDRFTQHLGPAYAVLAGAEARIEALGGAGRNVLALLPDPALTTADLDGVLDVRFKGGSGPDTLQASTGAFVADGGTLRVRFDGAGGNDALRLWASAVAGSTNPIFDAALAGGAGNDTIEVGVSNAGPNLPANYGRLGQVLVDGLGGADSCTVSENGLVALRGCE